MSDEYIPRSAMSIHAHPDDQEFTVGGTLAKWAKAGCGIISVIITDGSAGTNDPEHGPEYKPTLAQIRADEQRAANAILGIQETIFLGHPDGELEPTISLRRELTRLIRRFKPQAVVIGDPTAVYYGNGYINHPDHRAAAEAALYAVFPSAGSRPIFMDLLDEGLELHEVKRLYIHGSEKPDTWVDITETLDLKIKALQQHPSQVPVEKVGKWMTEWAQEDAKDKDMKYAESFKVMILKKDKEEESKDEMAEQGGDNS
jgi:LmbE family N-acetylglucosaminyl deacetylase